MNKSQVNWQRKFLFGRKVTEMSQINLPEILNLSGDDHD